MISVSGTRRLHILLLAAILACGLGVTFSPVRVSAIDQGGIGGRPARPEQGNPRSQSIFVHTAKPGEQAKDAIEVINNASETKHVLVYAVDSQVSSGGAFACAQAADKPISVGEWIALNHNEVTLNPGAKQTVDFTITVPKDTAPGEHNGCIVIQDTKQQAQPDGNGIVLSLRSAIRVAITIPGDIKKGLAFTGLGFTAKDDAKILLSTALKNSGNVSLDTQVEVKLSYVFGVAASKAGGNFPVLSSSEGRFNFESSRPFWGGWYKLTATARYDDNLANALGEGSANASTQRSMWAFIVPDPLAAVIEGIAAIVLVGGIAYLVYRKRRHGQMVRRATGHLVKPGEDLHSVAEMYAMQWKHLARINKLKPPYQIKAGQKLLVAAKSPAKRTPKNTPKSKRTGLRP
jgi:hypothetical protein